MAGTYGCYGIVDPSQVSPKEGEIAVPSNGEMQRFSDSVGKAEKMQIKEHKKKAPVEVEIKSRQKNSIKNVKTNKKLVNYLSNYLKY